MLRLIPSLFGKDDYERGFSEAMQLRGSKERSDREAALVKLKRLLKKCPVDKEVRREIIVLSKELHLPYSLPRVLNVELRKDEKKQELSSSSTLPSVIWSVLRTAQEQSPSYYLVVRYWPFLIMPVIIVFQYRDTLIPLVTQYWLVLIFLIYIAARGLPSVVSNVNQLIENNKTMMQMLDQVSIRLSQTPEGTVPTQITIEENLDTVALNPTMGEKSEAPELTTDEKMVEALTPGIQSSEISKMEKWDPRESRRSSNLTAIVSHYKPKKLLQLRERIQRLQERSTGLIMCAITGVAGCGKSELAKTYAFKSEAAFKWRLDPDSDSSPNNASQMSYQQAYLQLLQDFNLHFLNAYESETSESFHQRQKTLLWKKINQYGSWIIIFDHAGSYTDIKSYLPINSGMDSDIKGQILITTQNQNFFVADRGLNFSINQGLDPEEAIQLLIEVSGRDQEDEVSSQKLVQMLDYSPLEIRVAGGYIRNVGITFEQYTRLLENNKAEPMIQLIGGPDLISQATEDTRRTTTLQSSIKLTLQKQQETNPLFRKILTYCGYMANNIPLDLLVELCRESQEDSFEIEQRLKIMMFGKDNHFLLSYDSMTQSCYLHRLTQVVIRDLTSSPMEIIEKIVTAIFKLYPYDEYSVQTFKRCKTIEAHFLALNHHIASHQSLTPTLVIQQLQLRLILGQLAYKSSQYIQALQYLQHALELTPISSSDSHLEFQVQILLYTGETQRYLRQADDSKTSLEQGIRIARKVYGPTDWHLARILNVLGESLQWNPDATNEEALNCFIQARKICEKIQPGSKDSNVQLAFSYLGMGRSLKGTPDYPGSLNYSKQALILFRNDLGESNPYTGRAYQDLGTLGLYNHLERFVDRGIDYLTSKRYIEQNLLNNIEAYGPYHFEVALTYSWRSHLLYVTEKKEDWELALVDRNQNIDIFMKIFGPEYSGLIYSYYFKGKILQKLQRETEAISAYHECVNLGRKHPGGFEYYIENSKEQLQVIQPKVVVSL